MMREHKKFNKKIEMKVKYWVENNIKENGENFKRKMMNDDGGERESMKMLLNSFWFDFYT